MFFFKGLSNFYSYRWDNFLNSFNVSSQCKFLLNFLNQITHYPLHHRTMQRVRSHVLLYNLQAMLRFSLLHTVIFRPVMKFVETVESFITVDPK